MSAGMKEIRSDADEPLKIEVRDDPAVNLVTVELQGRLNIFNYRDLAARLDALSVSRQGVRIILNLALVSFIASSGWSVFVATRGRLKRVEGAMAFCGMNEDLGRVYQAMKMHELVPSYASEEEARSEMTRQG